MAPLAEELVDKVRQLLDAGYSRRAVWRMTGVSRDSVGKIAAGTYPDSARLRREREERVLPGTGPEGRCAECRRFVAMPCVECTARKARAEKPRREQPFPGPDDRDGTELDLRDEEQTIYEEVYAMRVRQDRKDLPPQAEQAESDDLDDDLEEPPELAMLAAISPRDAREKLAAVLGMGPIFGCRSRSA